MKKLALTLAFAAMTTLIGSPLHAADPAKVTIVVFTPPSLGAIFPAVIKQQKFDIANGVDITFVERPPDAYAAQFNSGEFQVGGSASVLILGLGTTRGVKASYLFNIFDFWGTVVYAASPTSRRVRTSRASQLAAARGTTNFTMFEWFAKQQGVDPASLQVVNTATPGLVGYALADRADAVQVWEPAYTLIKSKKPDIHMIDLNIAKVWARRRQRHRRFPISVLRRMRNGSRKIARSFPASIAPTSRPPPG